MTKGKVILKPFGAEKKTIENSPKVESIKPKEKSEENNEEDSKQNLASPEKQ
jgi:hypothetical protein